MHLKTITPSPVLQSFIKCYYLSESNYTGCVTDVFFADGCVEVVFHVGLDFYRGDEKECSAKAIGQITKPLTMTAKGKGKSFGIWFLPHTFSRFSPIPLCEFNDKVIPLDTIFSNPFIDFVKNCVFENEIEKLVAGTNSYLIKKLQKPFNPVKEKIVAHAVQYIMIEKMEADLDRLAIDCNISNRYLQKIFLERIGFSPKFFMRVVRFQHALHHLITRPKDSLTSLTYDVGYYDQAHFIKEFKEFTGFAPSQFQLTRHPINQYFLNL